MEQPASRSESCNNNNNLDLSQHTPQCNQTDFFPFPGFTTNNKTDLEEYTPITKIPSSSIPKHPNSSKSPEETSSSVSKNTPPVEPSVSPEIQSSLFRSIHVSGTVPSTCYGAGHVISGITDRRKCKAKGILSAGTSNKLPKSGQDIFEKSSPSLIPFPTEASISWHLSPTYVIEKDDVVLKGLSSNSPCDTVNTQQEERILSLDFNGDCSPFSVDILSSGNVMQTPNSNSSLEGIQLKFPKDNLSPWDPPRLSSEFPDLSSLSNHTNLDSHASWVSNSTLENISESQMRISWRDEIVNGGFDHKDDLDCCRLLSDEENDDDGLLKSPKFLEKTNRMNHCEESICNDDGGLITSADSDWSLHYKNQSFKI